MHVCVYVFAYMCVYACLCFCLHVYDVCVYVCLCVCMFWCVWYICVLICVYDICMYDVCVWCICFEVYDVYVCMGIWYVCMMYVYDVCMCVWYVYVWYMCIYVYIYTHTYICIHGMSVYDICMCDLCMTTHCDVSPFLLPSCMFWRLNSDQYLYTRRARNFWTTSPAPISSYSPVHGPVQSKCFLTFPGKFLHS